MKSFSKYIIVFGIVSSVFDFITFYVLYKVFHMENASFQTGWFIESIATQILVVYVIRTKRSPFWKSFPSRYVVASTVAVVAFSWIIPFTPIADILSFVALAPKLLLAIAGIVLVYVGGVEVTKAFFYRAYPKAP
jgi:Mg2+-importing ATPase